MSGTLQLKRGTLEQHETYQGDIGEITLITDDGFRPVVHVDASPKNYVKLSLKSEVDTAIKLINEKIKPLSDSVDTLEKGAYTYPNDTNVGYSINDLGEVSGSKTLTIDVTKGTIQQISFNTVTSNVCTLKFTGAKEKVGYSTTLYLINPFKTSFIFPSNIIWTLAGSDTYTTEFSTYLTSIGRNMEQLTSKTGVLQIAVWTIGLTYYAKII